MILGDPDLLSVTITIACLVASLLCWRAARTCKKAGLSGAVHNTRFLWLVLTSILLLLGINKQLDLQTGLTALGRHLAYAQGWYDRRRLVQAYFFEANALLGVASLAILLWVIRGEWRRHILTLAGGALLVSFVLMREASFYHVDEMLRWHLDQPWKKAVFELGGIFCLAASAARFSYERKGDGRGKL